MGQFCTPSFSIVVNDTESVESDGHRGMNKIGLAWSVIVYLVDSLSAPFPPVYPQQGPGMRDVHVFKTLGEPASNPS